MPASGYPRLSKKKISDTWIPISLFFLQLFLHFRSFYAACNASPRSHEGKKSTSRQAVLYCESCWSERSTEGKDCLRTNTPYHQCTSQLKTLLKQHASLSKKNAFFVKSTYIQQIIPPSAQSGKIPWNEFRTQSEQTVHKALPKGHCWFHLFHHLLLQVLYLAQVQSKMPAETSILYWIDNFLGYIYRLLISFYVFLISTTLPPYMVLPAIN